jgi:hypothetical protein
MKIWTLACIIIIFCTCFTNKDNQNDVIFSQLYALQGKWIMKTKNSAIGEEWTKIDKNHLQNHGYKIRGNDTVITERVSLQNTKDGIFYTSTVEHQNNQQPIAFRLTTVNKKVYVFENTQHDYPKRITYNLTNKDSLYAWIDDGKEIPEKKSGFAYSRQK